MFVFASHESKENNADFIIWLVMGGLMGWVASMMMKTDAQQGVILNIVVGIVGAHPWWALAASIKAP